MPKHVLVVEDDEALARLLIDNLVHHGFDVAHAASAAEGQARVSELRPALVLLDLGLPDGDGFAFCSTLMAQADRPLVIIVSARGAHADKIRGLDLGADDYVTKPFSLDELLARMRAVMRRRSSQIDVIRLGGIVVDFRVPSATRDGQDLGLSPRELDVLRCLAERPARVVSRDELLHAVWGYRDTPLTRSVDICIARLRRKVENDPHKPAYIRTAHGDGYLLVVDQSTAESGGA